MEYNFKPSEDGKYIILTVVGDFTAKEMMKCVVESHSFGNGMGIHRYLLDSTRARNIDSAMGNYEFAYSDMKTTTEVDRLARVAVVVSPGDHSHDFVETVSENAGMTLKIFTDFTTAKEFLLKIKSSGK